MDNNRFINLNTFEITDSVPNYIMADKEIANTIAILNKKGYKTKASCASHYEIRFNEEKNYTDMEFLEDIKKTDTVIIKRLDDKSYDYWYEIIKTSIYIWFDKDYDFKNIPEGFLLENNTIRRYMDYYNGNKRKTREEFENEKNYHINILEKWAEELPVLERKED